MHKETTHQVGKTILGLTATASACSLTLVRDWDTNDSSDLVTLETDLTS